MVIFTANISTYIVIIFIFHVLVYLTLSSSIPSIESLLQNWTISDNNYTFKHGASGSMIASDSQSMIYIFGGYHDHDSIPELYSYDIINKELKSLSCNRSHSSSPSTLNDIPYGGFRDSSQYQPSPTHSLPDELDKGRDVDTDTDDTSLRRPNNEPPNINANPAGTPSDSEGITTTRYLTNKGNHSHNDTTNDRSNNNNNHDHYYSNVVTNSLIINNTMFFATKSGLQCIDLLTGLVFPPLIPYNYSTAKDTNYVKEPCLVEHPYSNDKFIIVDLRSDGEGVMEYDTRLMNISLVSRNGVKLHHDHIQGIFYIQYVQLRLYN